MPLSLRSFALLLTFSGAAFAIGAVNPFFGEPNLHPSPWVVCPGAVVAAVGAYLLAFKVQPRPPRMRVAGVCLIGAMAGLCVMSLVF